MIENLQKLFSHARKKTAKPIHPPNETREEMRQRLLKANQEAIERTEASRIDAYRDKDDDGIWLANATLAELKRFREKLEAAAPK